MPVIGRTWANVSTVHSTNATDGAVERNTLDHLAIEENSSDGILMVLLQAARD